MKSAKLDIVIHCANDLKDVKLFRRTKTVAIVSITGDGEVSTQETPVKEDGGCNPNWECSMHFDITSINGNYILFIKLEHRGRTVLGNRQIGEVQVPFADLLKAGDARAWCKATYPVTTSGKKQGEIIVSRKFSDESSGSSSTYKDNGSGSSSSRVNPPPPPPPPRRENPGGGLQNKLGTAMAVGLVEGLVNGVAEAATTYFMTDLLGVPGQGNDQGECEEEEEI